MTAVTERGPMTVEAFLAWEERQRTKHEFDRGEVFAMSGGSPRHNALAAALIRDLGRALQGGPCRVLTSDQKVALRSREKYVYPDASVVCGKFELDEGTRDVLTNPRVVVEVLSQSTEAYDRGVKWDGYRRLPSLSVYLLVSQTEVGLEMYTRLDDGSWRFTHHGRGECFRIEGAELDVDALYDGTFDLPGDDPPLPRP
ncbi:MAG: Uma2 family endonuclease [Myxococcota bacterium]